MLRLPTRLTGYLRCPIAHPSPRLQITRMARCQTDGAHSGNAQAAVHIPDDGSKRRPLHALIYQSSSAFCDPEASTTAICKVGTVACEADSVAVWALRLLSD